MATNTPNFGFIKPAVNSPTDADIWGDELNDNFDLLDTLLLRLIPVGAVILWSGSVGSIPTGYALCDGTAGTPNLRDKFVVGAGSTYAVGATGGSKDAVVVAHTHTATSTDAGHTHNLTQHQSTGGGDSAASAQNNNNVTATTTTGFANITTTVNSAGVSGTNANLPPYYALCYIMKT